MLAGITESINVKDFSGKWRRLGDKQQLNRLELLNPKHLRARKMEKKS